MFHYPVETASIRTHNAYGSLCFVSSDKSTKENESYWGDYPRGQEDWEPGVHKVLQNRLQ